MFNCQVKKPPNTKLCSQHYACEDFKLKRINPPIVLNRTKPIVAEYFKISLSQLTAPLRIQCEIDGKRFNLIENKDSSIINLTAKGSESSWQWSPLEETNAEHFEKFRVSLSDKLLSKIYLENFDQEFSNITIVSKPFVYDKQLENLLTFAKTETNCRPESRNLTIETTIELLAIYLFTNYSTKTPKPPIINGGLHRSRLHRVEEYINENLAENISLDDLAVVSGYSRYHFLRSFKKSTGLSPNQYLMKRRIACAKNLLEKTKKSVTEISLTVGYENPGYFAKQFKICTGVTPSEYRK